MAIHDALTEQDVQTLTDALLEWAELPDSVHLAGFSKKYKKTRTWLYDIAANHPTFDKALNTARDILSEKYVRNILFNQYNATFGEKFLPTYDKEYKSLLEWKAKTQDFLDKLKANKLADSAAQKDDQN